MTRGVGWVGVRVGEVRVRGVRVRVWVGEDEDEESFL